MKKLALLQNPFKFVKNLTIAFAMLLFVTHSQSSIAKDVGVFKIVGPVSSCASFSGAEKVSIIVVNNGKTAIDSIPVAYRIDTGTVVRDTIVGSLGAGDSINFTFATSADLSADSSYKITAYTALATDSNRANDTASVVISTLFFKAGFTANGSCQGTAISFTNASSIDSGTLFYAWNFGDGLGSSTNTNPTYTYSKSGTYIVSLVVNSSTGCKDSVVHTVIISTRPVAILTAAGTCIGTAIVFGDSSTIAGTGSITSTIWSFGDGDSSTTQNPSHIYSTTGLYNAVLIVTTDSGCSATATDSVRVSPLPVASFAVPSRICAGVAVTFSDSSKGNGITYLWSFSDGFTSTVASPSHAFATAGKYNAVLTITSNAGCNAVMSDSVTVNANPKATFSVFNVCLGDSARFTDMSTISGGSTLTYSWNFGDTSSAVYKSPAHLYKHVGTYTAMETVKSSTGCADSVSEPVKVNPLPTGGFTTTVDNTLTVAFQANDTSVGNTYMWDFGDGTSIDTGSNPSHTFETQGIYSVTMTVKNGTLCSVQTTDSVDVVSTGIAQPLGTKYGLDVYPNPFSGMAYINYNLNTTGLVNLSVYDETGKIVAIIKDGPQTAGIYQYTFNASYNAAPGLYMVKLSVDGNTTVKKIMEVK